MGQPRRRRSSSPLFTVARNSPSLSFDGTTLSWLTALPMRVSAILRLTSIWLLVETTLEAGSVALSALFG